MKFSKQTEDVIAASSMIGCAIMCIAFLVAVWGLIFGPIEVAAWGGAVFGIVFVLAFAANIILQMIESPALVITVLVGLAIVLIKAAMMFVAKLLAS